MIKINIVELLKKENKTKYWLCNQMNMTSRNLNRIINGKTTAQQRYHLNILKNFANI